VQGGGGMMDGVREFAGNFSVTLSDSALIPKSKLEIVNLFLND
jgi:hypothetical protein